MQSDFPICQWTTVKWRIKGRRMMNSENETRLPKGDYSNDDDDLFFTSMVRLNIPVQGMRRGCVTNWLCHLNGGNGDFSTLSHISPLNCQLNCRLSLNYFAADHVKWRNTNWLQFNAKIRAVELFVSENWGSVPHLNYVQWIAFGTMRSSSSSWTTIVFCIAIGQN